AKTAIKLLEPKGGTIHFNGEDITNKSGKSALEFRKNMQMIFQDPYASLNPRYSVKDIVMEPLLFHNKTMTKLEAEAEVLKLLETVGIRPEQASRFPHQFSGGQRQRIGVARALAVKPKLIIADEPVSALDVSIQAQILNLLIDLKNENDLSYLFIAHDLSVVKHISDEIGVMYLGKIVEQANKNDLFDNPLHPYTKLLLSSIPTINEEILVEKIEAKGEIPSPINLPMGCYFSNRCPFVMDVCLEKFPDEKEIEPGHFVSCHLY
ncbi:MAG: ATP-binding cassette domain-containing protein, partial [Tissierellia bacterium]|nr:ATP-binding cassette domain-containing protein [Tissierellia bacterium]